MRRIFFILTFSIITILGGTLLHASEGEDAGTLSLFTTGGVGARAIGLGNAYVALPFDATAIYWNPAGMEFIQKKSVTFFFTNLLVEANYNFVGYVHPTLNFGTIGVGIIRIGVGDIDTRDDDNDKIGSISHSQNQFLLSYAKKIPFDLSLGLSIKFDYWDMGNKSDTGVGADVGLLYQPKINNILLRNLSLGFNIQNLLPTRLKLNEEAEIIPTNIKFGIAKPISLNTMQGSQLLIFLDFEQGGGHSSFKYHTGTEYVFQNLAMLRFGMNNNQLAFGAGVNYNMFQIDYSYGKFADNPLDASHRISVTVSFGTSKDELIRIAEEKRFREINRQVLQKIEWERNEKITRAMENGKRFLEESDYLRAQREFNIIIGFEAEDPDAIEIKEARELLKFSEEKYKAQMEKLLAEIQAQTARERKVEEDRIFISQHFEMGLTYYENEEFEKAIVEWKKILERDPDNKLALEHIKKAEVDYSTTIYSLIQRADALGRNGQFVEAINILNQAIGLNPDDQKIKSEISSRRSRYENRLSFQDLYRQGVNYQIRKEYKQAMEAFEKALVFDPSNNEVRKRFEEVRARAFAKREPMTGQVKAEFLKSLRLIKEGNYKEALDILEALQKIQPYNKSILDGIDTAREHLERQERGQNP